MYKLIVFIGPTGAGKSSLMLELVRNLSDRLAIIKSLTSRPRRGSEDDHFYQFVSREEIEKRKTEGRIFQVTEYAENFYANDKQDMDRLLNSKYGLIALVEESIACFKDAGYDLIVVRIKPKNNPGVLDAIRTAEDTKHAAVPVKTDLELVNSFKPGGREQAIRQLFEFIHKTLV
ncbi:MAG: hypothetical protein ABIB04_02635 [Patescibacteria group bacterium]